MQVFGLAHIGKDAELRHLPNGDAVINLALAFSYGKKQDGKRPTQWVDGTLWGTRAEALAQYLVKGTAVAVTLDEVRLETYQGPNGQGHKLVGKVSAINFAGGGEKQEAAPKAATSYSKRPAPKTGTGFDDMD